uniref:Protein-PII uridylyltransferase N-terminal domain-containing protein n=1 Tax=Branchiostoma floridae TaxID=7739 RepID=C3YXT8_BRAFL|eukprot:XP_002598885.1 hypothetical protein BRAFLDRAFT_90089 [Branchiostoma floridae]
MYNSQVPKMLRVCQKLRAADAHSKRLGLVRTETDYLRALLDAMADMDRCAEVEVLKTLGDVNLEKGRLEKNPEKFDRAMVLYRTTLIRCKDAGVGDSLEYRYHYAEKLRLGKGSTATSSYEPLTNAKRMSSLTKVAEKFQHLDRRLTVGGNEKSLLIEYTKLVVEGIVNDDNMLEVEAIKSLGDVYLKRGTETRDAPCLTKATALYNTALARCEGVQGTASLIHRLLYTAKIREETMRNGNKSRRHRVQQQGHVRSRDFPVTSPNTDVIGDSKGQRSDRSYQEHLTTGDRALADGKLDVAEQNFASALRLIHDPNKPDRCKEADCLCRLGDVYVQRGKTTKEGRKFTQAAALYNAAMARTGEIKHSVTRRLEEIETWFLHYTANVETKPVSSDSATRQKKQLEEMRIRAKSKLDAIDQQHNPYQYDEDDPVMLTVEAERAEAVKVLFKNITKDRQMFIEDLVDECIATLGPPPCKYAFIGLGSQATELVTPYSDLEFAILIEDGKDNDVTRRSYQEHLATGDRALADGKLDEAEQNFASALRLIHYPNKPDRCKEADCLCRLGDVYVRRGKTTKEGRKFTQAAALYNAAMARTDEIKDSVTRRLQEIETWFLHYTANVETKSVPSDSTTRQKKQLEEMRTRAKSELDAISQQHNPYQYDEDDPVMLTVEAERAEAVKALFKNIAKDRQMFIVDLVDECIATLGPPPCKYAFIGLGSQATELVTPYSDLEFAILIEEGKDNDDTRRYFINLTHYLHLKVINLGETILPAMVIPSLNDFPENDWFFDSVTPRGFAFDGFMPWASKTPFGRDQTKTKPPISLIQTPAEMAKFQRLDVSVAEGYHLSDILRRVVLLAGEEALVTDYMTKLREITTGDLLSRFQSRLSAVQILLDNRKQLDTLEPTGQLINVKKDIYRFPGVAIEVLALCCQITLASTWSVIDELKEMGKIHEENAAHIRVLTSISAELRLRTYLNNGGQQDSMSPLTQMKYQSKPQEVSYTLTSVFQIPDIQVLFRYYCRAIPLKKCIPHSLEGKPKSVLKATILDTSHECRGRISRNLYLYGRAKHHLEAALADAGSDMIKRSAILDELGSLWAFFDDSKTGSVVRIYEESLRVRKSIYGDNTAHPDIAGSLNNLGTSWVGLGGSNKAIGYYQQSLSMLKTIYGGGTAHPDIAMTLNNLGSAWSKLGDNKNAISYYQQSLSMLKTIYGGGTAHPDFARTLNNLGWSWSKLGDNKKAISYYEQSLSMQKTIYGDNTAHPDFARTLNNLGWSWSKLGDNKKAISYYEQSLSMRKLSMEAARHIRTLPGH